MAKHENGAPGLGSVAEETARLLDALMGAVPRTGDGAAPGVAPEAASGGEREGLEPAAGLGGEEAAGQRCPTCGHVERSEAGAGAGGNPATEVCHLCPVCQLLRVVRSVRPETLDRLADLAAAVTDTLRDAAATRWRDTGADTRTDAGGDTGRSPSSTVEDIPVVEGEPRSRP